MSSHKRSTALLVALLALSVHLTSGASVDGEPDIDMNAPVRFRLEKGRLGCPDDVYIGFNNRTCSDPDQGPTMRKASGVWTAWKAELAAAGNKTYSIKTFQQQGKKYKCLGAMQPTIKATCSSTSVTILPGNGTSVWAFVPVKGSPGVYNIINIVGKRGAAGCRRFLTAPASCSVEQLSLKASNNGSGLQRWIIVQEKAAAPPPLPTPSPQPETPKPSPPSPTSVSPSPSPVPAPNAPSAPEDVVASWSPAVSGVIVTWSAPKTNGGTPLLGYAVSCVSAGGSPVAVSPSSFPADTLTTGPGGLGGSWLVDVPYTCSVVAMNSAGSSVPSTPSNAFIVSGDGPEQLPPPTVRFVTLLTDYTVETFDSNERERYKASIVEAANVLPPPTVTIFVTPNTGNTRKLSADGILVDTLVVFALGQKDSADELEQMAATDPSGVVSGFGDVSIVVQGIPAPPPFVASPPPPPSPPSPPAPPSQIWTYPWTLQTSPGKVCNSVTWGGPPGNEKFVAVGYETVMTSPDGVTWTSQNPAQGTYDVIWNSVTWGGPAGNEKFVAVGSGYDANSESVIGHVMTSPDGVVWTSQSSATKKDWSSVTWGGPQGNEKFVAVTKTCVSGFSCAQDSCCEYDPPCESWGGQTPNGLPCCSLPGYISTDYCVMTSPDGVTWTSQVSPTKIGWSSVTWGGPPGNEEFVSVGNANDENGLPAFCNVMTSPDGVTWDLQNSPEDTCMSVIWGGPSGNGRFVAVGSRHADFESKTLRGFVMNSPDGVTWTSHSCPQDGWSSVTWGGPPGNEKFVAVGSTDSYNGVMTSSDGATWTIQTSGSQNPWVSVAWGGPQENEKFVAVSYSGNVMTLGSLPPSSPPPSPPRSPSPSSSQIWTYPWTLQTSPGGQWNSITWGGPSGNEKFVAVGSGYNITSLKENGYVMTSPDGVTWTLQISPTKIGWSSVTWGGPSGNKKFVAVGIVSQFGSQDIIGDVMTSPDGLKWTSQIPANKDWTSVTWGGPAGNEKFVAVSKTCGLLSDSDSSCSEDECCSQDPPCGEEQTEEGLPCCSGAPNPGNVATDYCVMTSPDGVTWTLQISPTEIGWNSITWGGPPGNEKFVAVGNSFDEYSKPLIGYVMTSPDGVTWTLQTSPEDTYTSVTWGGPAGNEKFVAVGFTEARAMYGYPIIGFAMTSPDGVTWTPQTCPYDGWSSVTWDGPPGNQKFVAVGFTDSYNGVMTSSDGVTWTSETPASSKPWMSVAWGGPTENEKFVAVSLDGSVMTLGSLPPSPPPPSPPPSPPARIWRTHTVQRGDWHAVTWGGGAAGKFVVVSSSAFDEPNVMTSPDGMTWTSLAAGLGNDWYSVTWGGPTGNEKFVAVSWNGNVMTSPDGVTWTIQSTEVKTDEYFIWWAVTWGGPAGNEKFVAVGNGFFQYDSNPFDDEPEDTTNYVMTSPDGVTWAIETAPGEKGWYDVTWGGPAGNKKFVAVGIPGVMTSPDGLTWTLQTSAQEAWWKSVTWGGPAGNEKFLSVGYEAVMTSPDAITWTSQIPANGTYDVIWNSVTWGGPVGNEMFVAVGEYDPQESVDKDITATPGDLVMTSLDGVTWNQQISAGVNGGKDVTWSGPQGNEKFLVVNPKVFMTMP